MKKILVLLLSVFLVTGCGIKSGEVSEITVKKMEDKIKAQKTFVVVIEQDGCGYCEDYNETLKKYVKTHDVDFYTIDLKNEKDPKKAFKEIAKKYKGAKYGSEKMVGTPYTIVFEKGEARDSFSGELDIEEIKDIVDEYNLEGK